jgi:hypothetical protein
MTAHSLARHSFDLNEGVPLFERFEEGTLTQCCSQEVTMADLTPRNRGHGGRRRGRWTSFIADITSDRPRSLHEEGNPAHRIRVEHDDRTLLIHLSDEAGHGWTVLAVERQSRRWAVTQGSRQVETAQRAFSELYGTPPQRRPQMGVAHGGRGAAAAASGDSDEASR